MDNYTKFKAFEALDVSEKIIVCYQSTAHSPLLSRHLSIGEGKLLGRLPNEARGVENQGRRPRMEVLEVRFGGAVSPLPTS